MGSRAVPWEKRPVDLERLKRTLSDDLMALREGKSILGINELADDLEELGPDYRFHAQQIRLSKTDLGRLATEIVRVLEKLEGEGP
jgi:hypothetical protein